MSTQIRTQISNSILLAIVINIVYAKAIGVTQGAIARQVGADMWIVTILSILFGLLMMWVVVMIIKRTPEKNMLEQSKVLFGTWGEKIFSALFFLFFLGAYGGVMITIVYHLMDYFLPDVPTVIFIIATTGVGLYGLSKGIEVIGRFAVLGLFSISILNILILFGSLDNFHVHHFFPVMQNNLWSNLQATSHHNSDWAMAVLMVAIILPMVKQKEKWNKYTLKSVFIGGGFILMWPLLQVGTLSPEVTGQYIVSCMQMARSAEIGLFVHRYELIMVVFFSISALVQVMTCLICASISAKHVVGAKNINKLYLPTALLLGGFGYWIVDDHMRAMHYLEDYWPVLSMSIIIGITVLVLLFGTIFKRKLVQRKGK